jgi:hypothetical protein
MGRQAMVINRTQGLVLAFFLLAWIGVLTILVVAPQVHDQTLRRAPGARPVQCTINRPRTA